MKGITGSLHYYRDCELTYEYGTYNKQFSADKIEYRDNESIILLDGCILNLSELMNAYKTKDNSLLIKQLWGEYGDEMTQHLKGSFVLVFYDLNERKLFIAHDRLSKRPLYYYYSDGLFAFSSRFEELVCLLKKEQINLTPDRLGIAMMLQSGFLWENCTYVNEISCLREYESLLVQNQKLVLIKVEKPSFGSCQDTEDEALQHFNDLFTQAIKLQYKKNEDNGYAQLATLSGGMDSRSALMAAIKSGYIDIACVTYAQSGSDDYDISRRIAYDNNLDYFFYPLDSARFMAMPQERVALNEGMHTYYGSTGAYTVFHQISDTKYGIIHCGLLGGEQLGDQYPVAYLRNISNIFTGNALPLCDDTLCKRYNDLISNYSSEDELELIMHTRGCKNLFRMGQDRFELFSPFMDEDVYEYLFSLPIDMKFGRLFYCKWMNQYMPNAYKTTFFNALVPKSAVDLKYKVLRQRALARLNMTLHRTSKTEMNPITYWLTSNKALNDKIQTIYSSELSKLSLLKLASIDTILSSVQSADRMRAITAMMALNSVFTAGAN